MTDNISTTSSIDASSKPYRLILKMRGRNNRPLITSMSDVLEQIETHAFRPIGRLGGMAIGPGWVAGKYGAFCRVEGETETERFGICLPFIDGLGGVHKSGRKYPVDVKWFNTLRINPRDGSVLANRNLWLRQVMFRVVDLPFEWSALRVCISQLISRFANETGLAQSILGRDISMSWPDYPALAQIEIIKLDPVVHYVQGNWSDVSSDRPPSRETIAATLAGLNIRNRTRSRSISPR